MDAEATVTIQDLGPRSGSLSGSPAEAVRITSVASRYAITVGASGYRTAYDTIAVGSTGGDCPSVVLQKRSVKLFRLP